MDLVDQLSPALSYLNLCFQGEPFIHPLLPEMAEYAKSKKIYVSTSTNGHFINDENVKSIVSSGLDKLIISLDGADAESYGQYRIGGNFDTVITGIRKIVHEKTKQGTKKPKIVLQSLILKSNQHQFNQIRQLGKDLGVDKVELKTAQFYDFKEGNPLIPDDLKFSRYKRISDTPGKPARYKIKNLLPDHCFRMWSSCVITWDGSIVPCCFDKDARYNMGKVNGRSFKKAWKDKSYYDFRKMILYSRKSIDICTNCTEGTGVTCFL